MAFRTGHELKIIYCRAPDDVVNERLEKDLQIVGNAAANRNMEKYLRINETFDPLELEHLGINTDDPFSENLEMTIAFLGFTSRKKIVCLAIWPGSSCTFLERMNSPGV